VIAWPRRIGLVKPLRSRFFAGSEWRKKPSVCVPQRTKKKRGTGMPTNYNFVSFTRKEREAKAPKEPLPRFAGVWTGPLSLWEKNYHWEPEKKKGKKKAARGNN